MPVDLMEAFKKFNNEFNESQVRPRDLAAFNLLNKLVPGSRDMVVSAEHDEIWLDTDVALLAEAATEEDIKELVRLGVMYDESTDSLHMFV